MATADLCDKFVATAPAEMEHDPVASVLWPLQRDGELRALGGRRWLCGPVSTVACFEDNSMVKAAVGEPGQGRVLVVDGGASPRRSLLGDDLAKQAVANGWNGLVIYGVIRDAAVIAQLPLGVWALGTSPHKTHKVGAGARDIPINIANVAIRPGDFLYADDDGIVVAKHKLH